MIGETELNVNDTLLIRRWMMTILYQKHSVRPSRLHRPHRPAPRYEHPSVVSTRIRLLGATEFVTIALSLFSRVVSDRGDSSAERRSKERPAAFRDVRALKGCSLASPYPCLARAPSRLMGGTRASRRLGDVEIGIALGREDGLYIESDLCAPISRSWKTLARSALT